MSPKIKTPNRQVLRTRSWIFEAVMLLMDTKPYNKITVSDIVEKAGIARQTFYRNYADKDDVVFEYMENAFRTKVLKMENDKKKGGPETIVLSFNISYMIKYRKNLKRILSVADIENRITRRVQDFPVSLIEHYRNLLSPEDYLICRYKICYQIIGSLRIFFDWFVNDMPLSSEKIVLMLNAMNTPKVIQYRHIPSIVIKIDEG